MNQKMFYLMVALLCLLIYSVRPISAQSVDQRLANAKALGMAEKRYQAAVHNKDKDPSEYLQSSAELAASYAACNDDAHATQQYLNAADIYATADGARLTESSIDRLWDLLRVMPASSWERLFLALFNTSEVAHKKFPSTVRVDYFIIRAIQNRPSWPKDPRSFYQKLTEIESAAHSSAASSLSYFFLVRYGLACDSLNDVSNAEKLLARAAAINPDKSAADRVSDKMLLANLYFRHRLLERAKASWEAALKMYSNSDQAADSLVDIINSFQSIGSSADANRMMDLMLARGGDSILLKLNPFLEQRYDSYIKAHDITHAQSLAAARIKASATCENDGRLNDWQIRLSDAELMAGKTAESNQLFEVVRQSLLKRGFSPANIIQGRIDLLRRLDRQADAATLARSMPPTATLNKLRITHQLLAQQALQFEHNTNFMCINSRDPRRPGWPMEPRTSCASICCGALVSRGSNFSFNGTIFENDPAMLAVQASIYSPPRPVVQSGGRRAGGGGMFIGGGAAARMHNVFEPRTERVPDGTFPLSPPPAAPPNATALRGNLVTIMGGDFTATSLDSLRGFMSARNANRIRLFLTDNKDSPPTYALSGIMNVEDAMKFEIFYSGTHPINVSGFFCGVIYAPYAEVRVGFNTTVTGVIVANRIICEGNNSFRFDPVWNNQPL